MPLHILRGLMHMDYVSWIISVFLITEIYDRYDFLLCILGRISFKHPTDQQSY